MGSVDIEPSENLVELPSASEASADPHPMFRRNARPRQNITNAWNAEEQNMRIRAERRREERLEAQRRQAETRLAERRRAERREAERREAERREAERREAELQREAQRHQIANTSTIQDVSGTLELDIREKTRMLSLLAQTLHSSLMHVQCDRSAMRDRDQQRTVDHAIDMITFTRASLERLSELFDDFVNLLEVERQLHAARLP